MEAHHGVILQFHYYIYELHPYVVPALHFLARPQQGCKNTPVRFALSVCPSSSYNCKTAGRIFMAFYIGE
jgi:hypothetical protein